MEAVQSEEQVTSSEAPALAENTAQAVPEVDFDRVLAGDEEYIKATNESLGTEVPPVEPEPVAETKPEEPAKTELDPNEVVETITYRGEEIPVKRSQMKDLLQKGRHLEVRLEEIAPVLALAREVPELQEKLRTPEGRKQIIERIRQQEKAREVDDAAPEVEGYDKADVQAVDKILQARLKALGITSKQGADGPTPEQVKATEADNADLAKQTRITLESLRSLDPHYEANMTLLKDVVAEVERTTDPRQFRQFYEVINDPRRIDPSTGRPAFLNFYADINKERIRRETLGAQPAVPAIVIPKKTHESSGRMTPGAAQSPAAAGKLIDYASLSREERDRAFNEALARG